jgi:hypothetical protein
MSPAPRVAAIGSTELALYSNQIAINFVLFALFALFATLCACLELAAIMHSARGHSPEECPNAENSVATLLLRRDCDASASAAVLAG